eukprot:1138534-Pelagomonas_calceolata.AAC.10
MEGGVQATTPFAAWPYNAMSHAMSRLPPQQESFHFALATKESSTAEHAVPTITWAVSAVFWAVPNNTWALKLHFAGLLPAELYSAIYFICISICHSECSIRTNARHELTCCIVFRHAARLG